jgi:dienelactone hydrolase
MRAAVLALVLAASACATAPEKSAPQQASQLQVTVRDVEYREGDTVLRGHLALPAAAEGVRSPAVLVVHEWWGRGAHADKSAEELARLGYVGFAVDMYGDAKSTTDPKVAGEWAGVVRKDAALGRRRFRAALDYVRSLPEVDASRVASIGFCFGGTVSLDAAWAGEDLRGVVSFHGSLTTPNSDQTPHVKASVLVCHGADDPFVSKESFDAFVKSMRESKLDWELTQYAGAVHSFTNPAADGSFNPGAKYHAVAAARSWSLMESFLAERFR